VPAEDCAAAERVAVAARALGIEPLALDAETLAWSFEGASVARTTALARLEQAADKASEMQLGLLVARIRRRQVVVLKALGLSERAETMREAALKWARQEGVGAEVAWLERMGIA